MRIRLLGDVSGLRNGKPWPKRGTIITIPDDEGDALCASGMAERVQGRAPVEKATPRKDDTEMR
ncbi:hypothetical protein ACWY4P_30660 [Streptomyces sp. LZ34]